MKNRATILILLLLLPLASAPAAVTNLQVELTDPGSVLPNFTSNDLRIDFTGGLKGQQLVVQLTAGSIFQDSSFGTLSAPSGAFFPVFPSLQYDTFITLGGLTAQDSYPIQTGLGTTVIPGCPALGVDVCGGNAKFDNQGINITWAPATGVDVPSGSNFVVARVTLSDSAQGVVHYAGSTASGTGPAYYATGTIRNGVISFVPEPTTLGLFGLAASATCWNYRKRFTKREIV